MDLIAEEMDPGELTLAEIDALEAELDSGLQEAFQNPRLRTRAIAAVIAANRSRSGSPVTTDEIMATLTLNDINRATETIQSEPGVDPTVGANGASLSPSPAPTG